MRHDRLIHAQDCLCARCMPVPISHRAETQALLLGLGAGIWVIVGIAIMKFGPTIVAVLTERLS